MNDPRPDEVERELERFIADELLEEPIVGDPLESGAVDSLGAEQIAEHVEREFGVAIPDHEMIRENFESIPALTALVASKLAAEAR